MGVANIFARPGYKAFYRALADQRDIVHISRLDVGSQTAAETWGWSFAAATTSAGQLHRRRTVPLRPGAAHMHELLRYAIERGWRRIRFHHRRRTLQAEWCSSKIMLFDHVSAMTLRGCPLALRFYLTWRIKRWIKQTPALWNAAYRLRALLGQWLRPLAFRLPDERVQAEPASCRHEQQDDSSTMAADVAHATPCRRIAEQCNTGHGVEREGRRVDQGAHPLLAEHAEQPLRGPTSPRHQADRQDDHDRIAATKFGPKATTVAGQRQNRQRRPE